MTYRKASLKILCGHKSFFVVCFKVKKCPRTVTITGPSLFGGPSDPVQVSPSLLTSEEMNRQIKREKFENAVSKLKKGPSTPIELDSPSPAKKHARLSEPASSVIALPKCGAPVPNPRFHTLEGDEEDDFMPPVGEAPDEDQSSLPDDFVGGSGLDEKYKDVCLIVALRNLGLPVTCDKDGPFSVSYGNSLLQPFGIQLCEKQSRLRLPDGQYVVYDQGASS